MSNTEEELAKLKALQKQLKDLDKRKKDYPILFYKPIGNQAKFFSSRARNRYVFGSNRSGKSVSGAVELIACGMGFRPWLPKDHPDHIVRLGDGTPMPVPNVGFHLVESLTTSGKMIFIKKMQEWLPKKWGKVKTNNLGQPVAINFTNGSVCHVYSQNHDIDSLEGPNGHWFSCDEPPKETYWIAIKRGLVDFDGIAWITATPLKASHYMAELMNKANEDTTGEHHDLISLNIQDNRKSRGGYLPDAAVDAFIRDLPSDEVEARVYGRPKHLAGAIYKEWQNAPPYCVEPFDIPSDWPIIMAIDPAERKAMAAVWIAISPDNTWYIIRDLFDDSLRTVKQFANRVKEIEGWEQRDDGTWFMRGNTMPVAFRLIDTAGNKLERSSGFSIAKSLAQEDLYVMNADKRDFSAGINLVREMLTFDQDFEWNAGPQLVTFSCCRRVIYEFGNYIWSPKSSQSKAAGTDPQDKPLATNDDCLDCVRYLAVTQATYAGLVNILRGSGLWR